MPKETIKTRDGELTVGWNQHIAQIGIDLGKSFSFHDHPDEVYTDLYFDLDLEKIELLQKHLARVKRYLKSH
jgi:hypothetical protein